MFEVKPESPGYADSDGGSRQASAKQALSGPSLFGPLLIIVVAFLLYVTEAFY
ncbi:MAG: hypothetical protein P8X55_21235 [Desulfosarcinaceae bacterium]